MGGECKRKREEGVGWEETVVQLEGVLGEEVWRRKFEQREGKRHLSKNVGGGWTLETKGKRERERCSLEGKLGRVANGKTEKGYDG